MKDFSLQGDTDLTELGEKNKTSKTKQLNKLK